MKTDVWFKKLAQELQRKGFFRLVWVFAVAGLIGCRSMLIPSEGRYIEVTDQEAWWGAISKGSLLLTKTDLLMNETKIAFHIRIPTGFPEPNDFEDISVAALRAKPDHDSRWPTFRLIPTGTHLRCIGLVRLISLSYGSYILRVEFPDGASKGLVREIGLGLVSGDPQTKGDFDVAHKYFDVLRKDG